MPAPAAEPGAERGRVVGWLIHRSPVLLVSAVISLSLVLQDRGLVAADTKLDLAVDPGQFLRRALDLWDPTASFGRLQNQAVGYWFPMGPFFWLGELLGVPVWVTQRVWWSLIVLAALWGLVKLAEALDIGTPASRLVAAAIFATGPGVLIELGTRSPNVVPIALLPFALLPLVYGSRGGSPRRAAAASALVVLLMGGINAAVTGAALLVPLLFLLTRTPGPRRRTLSAWWIGAVAAVTAWWWAPLLLQQRYGFEFTAYTEDAAATTTFTSLTEILRGTSFWLARLVDGGNAWLPAGIQLATGPVAIAGTCLVTAAGLAGLAARRLPERPFLLLCLAAGVAAIGSSFAGDLGGPLAPQVADLLDGPLVVIRNIHKLAPLVALPLALGAAHSLGVLQRAVVRPPHTARARSLGVLCAAVAAVGVTLAGLPLATGEVTQDGSFEEIPGYWREAATWLNDQPGGSRALLVPGSTFGTYRWGSVTDEMLQPLAEDPWVVRDIIPFGSLRSARLLDGYEELFDDRRTPAGWAESLARSGVEWIVVRNDLDPGRSAAPDPVFVADALARAPGIERVAAFGPVVPQELARERLTPDMAAGAPPASVEIYQVDLPVARAATYDVPGSLAVLGSAEAVQQLADQGLLEGRGAILAPDDPALAAEAGQWVITDDLRRRDVAFGLIHDAASYSLQADEVSPDTLRDPVDRLLPGDEDSTSYVELVVAQAVRASSYYTGFTREPASQPYAAIDGDPATAWHMAGFREAEDEWWQIRLDAPQEVPAVEIQLPHVFPGTGHITEVRVTTDAGSVTGTFPAEGDRLRLELPAGPTERVRITILAADQGLADLLPTGIAEVTLEGVGPVERVVVTPEAPTSDPAAVVLARESGDPFETVAGTEDTILDRLVALPADATYQIRGTALAVPGDELDRLVALARTPAGDGPEVSATSTLEGLPVFDPQKAVDGDVDTAWVADITDGFPAIALRWDTPRAVDGLRLQFPASPALRPEAVLVTVNGDAQSYPLSADGELDLGGIVTDEIRLAPDVDEMEGRVFGLVGLAEIEVIPPAAAAAADPATAADPAAVPVELPCGSGPEVVIDEEAISTSVTGTLEDLERLQPMQLEACAEVPLASGEHRITGPVSGPVQVESLVMDPGTPLPPGQSRDTEVLSWSTEHRQVRVAAGDAPAMLALVENSNAGWVASLDGQELEPTTVDGWRQAWVVPAGSGGVIDISFAPGATYDKMLIAGLLLAVLVIAAAAAPMRASRTAPEDAPPRSVSDLFLMAAGMVALAFAAGPVALAVPVVWLVVRRPHGRVALAVLAFAAIGALMLADRIIFSPELTAHGQLLAGVAIAAVCVGPARSPALRRGSQEGATRAGRSTRWGRRRPRTGSAGPEG